jgi:hypothetical protein
MKTDLILEIAQALLDDNIVPTSEFNFQNKNKNVVAFLPKIRPDLFVKVKTDIYEISTNKKVESNLGAVFNLPVKEEEKLYKILNFSRFYKGHDSTDVSKRDVAHALHSFAVTLDTLNS